jgi:TonB-dependent receptor
LYLANPEYFTQDATASFRERLIYPRTVEEQIDAGYIEASADVGDLRMRGGLRYERTETTGWRVEQRTTATIARERPDLVPNTIPYVLYQYYDGEQRATSSSYDDLFLSGGAKYRIRRNLDAQVSFSDGILRPNYNNLAGNISFNETTRIATVPNPVLKPEHSTKYYGGLSCYFEPAGALSVGMYVMRIGDLQTPGAAISQEAAGYADYPEFNDYTFLTAFNAPNTQETRGFEIDYRQQLTFLPSVLKGLSIYGSFSRVIASEERLGVINKSGSGGVSFRYKDFSARLNGTWQAAYLNRKLTTAEGNNYLDERTSLDAEASYRIFKDTAIFINGRNITDAPFRQYAVLATAPNQALRGEIARYGTFWTVGIKGRF